MDGKAIPDDQPADLVTILITGPENPKRLPSDFSLAATAGAAEQKVVMYSTGPATELPSKGKAKTILPMDGGKSVPKFIKLATDNDMHLEELATTMHPHPTPTKAFGLTAQLALR